VPITPFLTAVFYGRTPLAKPNYKMNNRLVSARFWGNEDLAALTSKIPNLKLTMIGLWSFADEAGIFEWKPRVAASLIYPLEPEFQPNVEPAMNAFVEGGHLRGRRRRCDFQDETAPPCPHDPE
jgi:hypothetical protein